MVYAFACFWKNYFTSFSKKDNDLQNACNAYIKAEKNGNLLRKVLFNAKKCSVVDFADTGENTVFCLLCYYSYPLTSF